MVLTALSRVFLLVSYKSDYDEGAWCENIKSTHFFEFQFSVALS